MKELAIRKAKETAWMVKEMYSERWLLTKSDYDYAMYSQAQMIIELFNNLITMEIERAPWDIGCRTISQKTEKQ